MATLVLSQIPDPYIATTIAAHKLPLIRMDHYIIYWHAVAIIPLDGALSCVPDLDRAVFRRCDHPFPLAVEGDACYVGGVPVEG